MIWNGIWHIYSHFDTKYCLLSVSKLYETKYRFLFCFGKWFGTEFRKLTVSSKQAKILTEPPSVLSCFAFRDDKGEDDNHKTDKTQEAIYIERWPYKLLPGLARGDLIFQPIFMVEYIPCYSAPTVHWGHLPARRLVENTYWAKYQNPDHVSTLVQYKNILRRQEHKTDILRSLGSPLPTHLQYKTIQYNIFIATYLSYK
jgi:hypothetical protein